jgi:hypothetical protein
MSEKSQPRKSMFQALGNMEELRRLYDSDTPVLAYVFKRRTIEGWTEQSTGCTVPRRMEPTGHFSQTRTSRFRAAAGNSQKRPCHPVCN